jgi:hypothetical protein
MKHLAIDYVKAVIEHEAVILGENIFWHSGRTYPQDALEIAVTKKLITSN